MYPRFERTFPAFPFKATKANFYEWLSCWADICNYQSFRKEKMVPSQGKLCKDGTLRGCVLVCCWYYPIWPFESLPQEDLQTGGMVLFVVHGLKQRIRERIELIPRVHIYKGV